MTKRVFAKLHRLLSLACAVVLVSALVPASQVALAEELSEVRDPSVEALLAAGDYVEGEAIVLFRDPAPSHAQSAARSFDLQQDPLAGAGFTVKESWDFSDADAQGVSPFALDEDTTQAPVRVALVAREGADTATLIEELQALDFVEAVEPNYYQQLDDPGLKASDTTPVSLRGAPDVQAASFAADMPVEGTSVLPVNDPTQQPTNDPLYAFQWSLENNLVLDDGVTPVDSDINFASLYKQAQSGEENIVAVVDTGVDYTHEDLKNVMWRNPGTIGLEGDYGYDCADNDDDPMPDLSYHGTHVAGIIAAEANNGTGIAGISPQTKIMALKVTNKNGVLPNSAKFSAFEYVLKAKRAGQNVVAVNASFVGWTFAMTYAIDQMGRAGVLCICAAGNEGVDATGIYGSPGLYASDSPYAIAVASSSVQKTYTTYSSHSRDLVDVAAPGSVVLSAVDEGMQEYLPAVAQLLDEQAGSSTRSLYYHNLADFAQGAQDGVLIRLSGGRGEPADQSRLKVSRGVGIDGRPALRFDVKDMKDYPDEMVEVRFVIANPFKGMAKERALAARITALPSVVVDQGDENKVGQAVLETFLYDADGRLATSFDGANLASADMRIGDCSALTEAGYDRVVDDDTITVSLQLLVDDFDPRASRDAACSLTLQDFGIGFAEGAPYSYESGTSMACPTVAGAVGLLASLYPDEDALERRGRIVGGMKELNRGQEGQPFAHAPGTVDIQGKPKQTATNGTLDLPTAASDATHPSTWAATLEGEGGLVLEGYALDQVEVLSIDGQSFAQGSWSVSSGGERLVLSGAHAFLDGGRHEVFVADATGMGHGGTYALPFAQTSEAPSFQQVSELPPEAPSEGALIAAADGLYYLDEQGRSLYFCNPDNGGTWDARTAPVPCGIDKAWFESPLAAAYMDGKLYVAVQQTVLENNPHDPDTPYSIVFRLLSYDTAADEWSDVAELMRIPAEYPMGVYRGVGLAACEGKVVLVQPKGVLVSYDLRTQELQEIILDHPSGVFDSLFFPETISAAYLGERLCFLGIMPVESDEGDEEEFSIGCASFDGLTSEVMGFSQDALQPPRMSFAAANQYLAQGVAATGNGFVFCGRSAQGLGVVYALDCSTGAWAPLDARIPDGALVQACFYRGNLYALALAESSAVGARTEHANEAALALYRMPESAAAELAPRDFTVDARATGDGAASVSYAPLSARGLKVEHVVMGDTVAWEAVPQEGASFCGWFDAKGNLVSAEPRLERWASADVSLEARFAPAGSTTPGQEDLPPTEPKPGSDATPSADTLAPTGDPVSPVATILVALAAASAVALAAARRRHVGLAP